MQESNSENFNHLKIHSQFSICEGAIKIDDLKDISKHKKLKALATEIGLSAAQLLIAWSIRKNDIITIPKASNLEHVSQNIDAWTIKLESAILDELDKLFEPPVRKMGLDIL